MIYMRKVIGVFRKNFFGGIYEILILLILKKNLAPMYGLEIAKIIEEFSGKKIRIGASALYTILNRLERAGYLRSTWRESEYGPPRRYYTITIEGEDFLKEMLSQWEVVARLIGRLKKMRRNLISRINM